MSSSTLREPGAPVAVLYDGGAGPRPLYGYAGYGPPPAGAGADVSGYLFAPPGASAEEAVLVVPPFRIARFGQRFIQPGELRIEVGSLAPDVYRILAVQNFWIEDDNPDLGECLAAVFLARRRANGRWEAPETWPIECRTLAELGRLDARGRHWSVEWFRDHEHR